MTDYTVTDPAQEARFVAFVQECEDLIQSARGHNRVVTFLRSLDIHEMRGLYALAVKANATALIGLIGVVADEKGWHA